MLASVALLGVGGDSDSPPIKFTRLLARLDSARWVFLFYNVRSPTPWIFDFSGLSAVSDMDILEVGALSAHLLPCR